MTDWIGADVDKPSWVCRWDGCRRMPLENTSICAGHHNQAHREFERAKTKAKVYGTCVMPDCGKFVYKLQHLHLCGAHLAIVAKQVTAEPEITAVTEVEPWTGDDDQDFRIMERRLRRQEAREAAGINPVIYYVQVGAHIKIGWTSNLDARMRQYPPNSVLLAVHPGSRADEAKLHKRFAAHRTHGREWYAPVPSVLHHIDAMKREHGEPDTVTFGARPVEIPEPRPTQYVTMRSRSGASYRRTSA